jgi:hypothetical protein
MPGINDRHKTAVSRSRVRTDQATASRELKACLQQAVRRAADKATRAWLSELLRHGEFVEGGLSGSDG